MSNTINLRYKRQRIIKTFKPSGAGAVNDCSRPGRDAGSKADFIELHREKVRNKKAKRFGSRFQTVIQEKVAAARKKGTLFHSLMNISRNKKRTRDAVPSIWPEGKVAKPGRMG
jgi:hypothetical protein